MMYTLRPGYSVPLFADGTVRFIVELHNKPHLGIAHPVRGTTIEEQETNMDAGRVEIQELLDLANTGLHGELPTPQEPKYRFQYGLIINHASGEAIPLDEPVMVFRARDTHAMAAIAFYYEQLQDDQHAEAVRARYKQFAAFAIKHPERMKEPDTQQVA